VIRRLIPVALILACGAAGPRAAAPVHYLFTFPAPEHHWMQVEAQFSDLGAAPLELRISRSSPGRYAIHEFAKNVYDVRAYGRDGRELTAERPDASGWLVRGHGGDARVTYKVYGDRLDGTYLAIDATHAHINMPAAIMWARGLDDRPAVLVFEPPAALQWQMATQLHRGGTAFEATAPNLQYLMDSPVELARIALREFQAGGRRFRFAAHHLGSDGDLGDLVRDVETIVREEGGVFGEFPEYEPGAFTFLADYLPYAMSDGMEHRNSTVMTTSSSIREDRLGLLETVAHEFFHSWNVERIRPRDLEPFDLDRENVSGGLWLAEGFTDYYAWLTLARAGLRDRTSALRTMSAVVDTVVTSAGRQTRSAVEASRMAAFTDGLRPVDRTNWPATTLSYYHFGDAIALALDLTLRGRPDARTLDDFMRALWREHGRPGGAREGYVDRPYGNDDAEARLAEVAGDPAFARDFFARYVDGRETADYAALLRRAGLLVRKTSAGRAWWGDVEFELRDGVARVASLVAPTWPAYASGLEQDDTVLQLAGTRVSSADDVAAVLRRHRPGDRIGVAFVDRAGTTRRGTVTLVENPHIEIVAMENAGGRLGAEERAFRERWLASRQ
jgi:predicted metalloprotease with PDZ domain